MGNIELSVIVPTYNQKKTIGQTLESILDQEYPCTYEIIPGNDCSTDGTGDIIKDYAAKYPSVIFPVQREENIGPMENWFDLVEKSRGTLVMWCDGDDYWLPDKVKSQIKYMREHPQTTLCYGKIRLFDTEKGELLEAYAGEPFDSPETLLLRNRIPSCTSCFRKELFSGYMEEVNPREKGWMMGDYPFWLWAAYKGETHFQDQVYGVYRISPGSMSHPSSVDGEIRMMNSDFEVKQYYNQKYQASNWSEVCKYHFLRMSYLYKRKGDYKGYRECLKKVGGWKSDVKYLLSFAEENLKGKK